MIVIFCITHLISATRPAPGKIEHCATKFYHALIFNRIPRKIDGDEKSSLKVAEAAYVNHPAEIRRKREMTARVNFTFGGYTRWRARARTGPSSSSLRNSYFIRNSRLLIFAPNARRILSILPVIEGTTFFYSLRNGWWHLQRVRETDRSHSVLEHRCSGYLTKKSVFFCVFELPPMRAFIIQIFDLHNTTRVQRLVYTCNT